MESNEVKSLLSAMDDLIDIKVLIRNSVPNYELKEKSHIKFIEILKSLKNKLSPIFLKYLTQENQEKDLVNVKDEIIKIANKGNIFLLSANSSKKRLKTLGLDPRNMIITGGPIEPEDYKIVNPNLPNKALENIAKKCKTLKEDIKKKDWNICDLYFIYESKNSTDQLILKRIDEINKIIGKDLKLLELRSWKELEL